MEFQGLQRSLDKHNLNKQLPHVDSSFLNKQTLELQVKYGLHKWADRTRP